MANIKFSAFTQKVVETDVDFLVGYTGADNVRISPSTIGQGVYLPLAGGTMTGDLKLNDDVVAKFGNSNDLRIQHSSGGGGIGYIQNYTGDLQIQNRAADKDILFRADDGSGVVTSYLVLDGSTTHAYFLNPGNVGIGTASPSYKFTAYGSSSDSEIVASFGSANDISEYTAIGLSGFIAGNDATKAGLALERTASFGVGKLHFLNNTTIDDSDITLSDSRMVIDIDGNVGVGTTSPSSFNSRGRNLVVNSDGDTGITISANSTSSSTLLFADAFAGTGGTATYRGVVEYDHSSDSMAFSTAAAYRMRITNTGNVGIGTTSPGAKLEVRKGGTTAAQGDTDLIVQDSTAGGSTSQVQILGGATGFSNLYFSDTSAYNVGGFIYNHSSNYLATNVNGSEKMRITSAGNVGIGTTNPVNRLQVTGASVGIDSEFMIRDNKNNTIFQQSASTSATNRTLTIANATYSKIVIPNGSVGIGITSPTATLHIESADDALLRLKSTDNKAYIALSDNDTNGYISSENTRLSLGANIGSNANNLNIDLANNKVGIGTSSPASKLEVDGGDVEVSDSLNGLILKSPDGTRYRVTVANGGTLTVSAV